ncbi:ATP-binding protein [Methanoplanus endosymbiosus]|uniref:ATP-binding protein n=1 Tax=Methanoplanus endosymbiosus TaxID=33865 RepID=A0A9E7PNB7_9EURY|nr:ATP-binding protein [Methanoplanus endosymbiosus]UUX92051.1 ATP-binding protein [Methanoplanus endosymbiosus]
MSRIFYYRTDSLTVDKLSTLSEAFSDYLLMLLVPEKVSMKAELIFEEITQNIVNHGYILGGFFSFRCTFNGEVIEMEFRDRGKVFNPLKDAPLPDMDSPVEERDIGGLGVHLVKEFSDDMIYTRDGTENVLMLNKIIRNF